MENIILMKTGRRVLGTLSSDKEAGFFLLEIAIALSIAGVMLSFALPMYTHYQQAACWRKTEENQKEVKEALIGYFSLHHSLPYAADESGEMVNDKKVGYIPYKKLGIPAKLACDGFNKPMGYAVNISLAGCYGIGDDRLPTHSAIQAQEGLVVKNERGETVVTDDMSIVFVLVAGQSHSSSDEQKNWDTTNDFIDRPFSVAESHLFRQKVSWMTYSLLATKAGIAIPRETPPITPDPGRENNGRNTSNVNVGMESQESNTILLPSTLSSEDNVF